MRIYLLSHADKEQLTHLYLILISWAILVCDLVWQKEIQRKKSQNDQQNSPPFTNPGVQPWQLRLQENLKMAGGADFWSRGSLYCYIQFEFLRSTGISWLWRAKLSKVTNTWHTECGRCLHCLLFLLHRHQLSDHKLYIWDMSPFCNNPHNVEDHCWCNISRPKQLY